MAINNQVNSFQRGNELFKSGKLPEAIAAYTQATWSDPDCADIYFNRAVANLNMGNLLNALADCQKGLQLSPNCVEGHRVLAGIHLESRNYKQAYKAAEAALALDSNCASAYQTRGMAFHYTGQPPKALRDLRTAAMLFRAQGALENHRQVLTILQRLDPNLWRNLATTGRTLGVL